LIVAGIIDMYTDIFAGQNPETS